MTDEFEGPRGFKVIDRRRFTPEGETAGAELPRSEGTSDRGEGIASRGGAGHEPSAAPADGSAALPEITLAMFVMSLSTQVLMHLGEIKNPIDDTVHCDMDAAKQVIDILAMLRTKTSGNLDANELQLFDSVLYDLRMRYVQLAKAGPSD